MTVWNVIPADRRVTHAAVALELRDEFTGSAAIGPISLTLDFQDGPNWWESTLQPVRNAGGIYLYTGLGRRLDPAAEPTFRVRVRIDADYYRPGFAAVEDGIEFDVPTYNDQVAPVLSPLVPTVVLMWPRANYPYAAHIRRIRGRVIDAGGAPMADAQIEADGVERVMTDTTGAYTLPLRWQDPNGAVNTLVTHPRSGLSDNPIFNLPADLVGNKDITVT